MGPCRRQIVKLEASIHLSLAWFTKRVSNIKRTVCQGCQSERHIYCKRLLLYYQCSDYCPPMFFHVQQHFFHEVVFRACCVNLCQLRHTPTQPPRAFPSAVIRTAPSEPLACQCYSWCKVGSLQDESFTQVWILNSMILRGRVKWLN